MIFILLHGELVLKQPIICVRLVQVRLKNQRLMQRSLALRKNVIYKTMDGAVVELAAIDNTRCCFIR